MMFLLGKKSIACKGGCVPVMEAHALMRTLLLRSKNNAGPCDMVDLFVETRIDPVDFSNALWILHQNDLIKIDCTQSVWSSRKAVSILSAFAETAAFCLGNRAFNPARAMTMEVDLRKFFLGLAKHKILLTKKGRKYGQRQQILHVKNPPLSRPSNIP